VGADGSLYIADATNHRIRKAWLRPCDPEAAKQRADALRAGAGGSFRGWLEVAELYLIAEDRDAALAAAQKLLADTSQADEHARLRVDVLLGRIYAAKRDDHEARRCWMRVLARARDPVLLRQAAEPLVNLYQRRGERHQAIVTLDDLRLRTDDRELLNWIDQRLKEIAGD
jgi:lipopolysaccharide biosynthesis regulator YciM